MNLQKIKLMETAAMIVKSEMKDISRSFKEYFPTTDDLSVDMLYQYMPGSLKLLLEKIFVGSQPEKLKMKMSAIGHVIIPAGRPRAIHAHMQVAIDILLHHHYQSKYLIDILHALVFCYSYKEVLMFERNAAMESTVDFFAVNEDSFCKFSADNVDHNTCTLDGRNTFHVMGMIASITNGHFSTKKIPRREVLDDVILKKSHVPIVQFNEKSALLKGITFKTLEQKCLTKFYGDNLWCLSYYFKNPTPA